MKILAMDAPSTDFEFDFEVHYIKSMNPGQQLAARLAGDEQAWEVDCPNLGHRDPFLNRVEVIQLNDARVPRVKKRDKKRGVSYATEHRYPHMEGRYFQIPSLDSPVFYSLRAAARWAYSWGIE